MTPALERKQFKNCLFTLSMPYGAIAKKKNAFALGM